MFEMLKEYYLIEISALQNFNSELISECMRNIFLNDNQDHFIYTSLIQYIPIAAWTAENSFVIIIINVICALLNAETSMRWLIIAIAKPYSGL